ncbi:unnamed protein product [Boreogadus saida]
MDDDGRDAIHPGMDHITTAVLKAANISTDMLPSLSKEDLRDLFPGPEHFLRRTIWRLIHDEDKLMDKLQRILNRGNSHFITEIKTRWGDFYAKAQFYGVFKKVMRPQLLDKAKQSLTMLKALPDMFPSPVVPPKSLQKTPTPFFRPDRSPALSSLSAKQTASWPMPVLRKRGHL